MTLTRNGSDLPEPGTPAAGAAIRTAALDVIAALDRLRPLIAPYHGRIDSADSPTATRLDGTEYDVSAEHFHAYHFPDLDDAQSYSGRGLFAGIMSDLLGHEHDGWEWLPTDEGRDVDLSDPDKHAACGRPWAQHDNRQPDRPLPFGCPE